MKKYTREDKLRISEQLLASEYWEWLKSEYEKEAKRFETSQHTDPEKDKTLIFRQGIYAGIKLCLELPETVRSGNEKLINRIMSAVMGDRT